MADMMCTLEWAISGRCIVNDDGTYGLETGVFDCLWIAREGLCNDGDVVSTLLLDLHRGCETHNTCLDGGCQGRLFRNTDGAHLRQ